MSLVKATAIVVVGLVVAFTTQIPILGLQVRTKHRPCGRVHGDLDRPEYLLRRHC
jgi:hypothetical protein